MRYEGLNATVLLTTRQQDYFKDCSQQSRILDEYVMDIAMCINMTQALGWYKGWIKTNTTLYIDLFPANLSADGHNGGIQPLSTCYNKQLSEQ